MRNGAGRPPVITIDGPAGAGKTTAARGLARRLGFRLLDTGALYRAVAWAVRQSGLSPVESPELAAFLGRLVITVEDQRVLVDGRDVTAEIRTPAVSALTSALSALPSVRERVTPILRGLAAAGGVVLEGRDTGSAVCPDAEIKFYLDARLEVRARRRHAELRAAGTEVDLDGVAAELLRRDRQDMARALMPLTRPAGAVVVDSTDLDPEAVVEALLEAVEQACRCTRS
jgi:cytidylate kinase